MQKRSVQPRELEVDRYAIPKTKALSAIGPVVYAIRLDGGVIKIGFTTNLLARLNTLRNYTQSSAADVLAVLFESRDVERAIHESLPHSARVRGREYYHPTAEVLAVVNDMRTTLNLPHIAA